MKVALAVVCDYAEVRENLLTLVAAGITRLRRDTLPAPLSVFVALQLELTAGERPFPHEVSVRVMGPAGNELATIAGGFQVASSADFEADESGVVSLPFDLRMVTAVEFGWYTVEITIDGSNKQSLRLKVTRPPTAAAPGPGTEGIRIATPDVKRH
jgi:hypothetical protein